MLSFDGAPQTLIARAADDMDFDAIKGDLETVRLTVGPKTGDAKDEPETAGAELAHI